MKSKYRLTLIVKIGANGFKYPSFIVDEEKMPIATRYFNGGNVFITSTQQKNVV